MDWLNVVRGVKFLGVSALLGGALGLLVCRSFEDRRRIAFGLIVPGFGVTWTAGFLLAYLLSTSLLATWILAAMGLSMLALLLALFSVSKPERDRPRANLLSLLPLVLALFFMLWRPE